MRRYSHLHKKHLQKGPQFHPLAEYLNFFFCLDHAAHHFLQSTKDQPLLQMDNFSGPVSDYLQFDRRLHHTY